MPQFPDWKRQLATWTDAASLPRSQLSSQLSEAVSGLVSGLTSRIEELPRTVSDEIRRRVNVLGLATKHDVEVQSKLGRSRVSFVLKEFLEAQRVHDEDLLQSLRAEIQEELQCFAAAIDDDLFAPVAPAGPGLDDADVDLVDFRELESMPDDEIDLLDVADD